MQCGATSWRAILRKTNAVIVMGGLHASMNYKEAVRYCDYVLLGEGDESILELVDAVKKKVAPAFPGVAYRKDGRLVHTGERKPPEQFETIPDKNLVYHYKKMAGHNTLWGQVHASRGCPHNCDYCALVRHFGRRVRTRSPENVLEDIRRTIAFHEEGHHRLLKALWITDDIFLQTVTGRWRYCKKSLTAASNIISPCRRAGRSDWTMRCSCCSKRLVLSSWQWGLNL